MVALLRLHFEPLLEEAPASVANTIHYNIKCNQWMSVNGNAGLQSNIGPGCAPLKLTKLNGKW